MSFLANKRALIVGLASKLSIAAGVAEAFHAQGCALAFTYQNDKLKSRVTDMAAKWGSNASLCFPCDVTVDEEIDTLFTDLSRQWSQFDILVHSVAYAPGELLEGQYLDHLDRKGFSLAHDVSSYSFAALAKAAHERNMLREQGALITMTYLGAARTIPHYNVMGVAKASLEANMRYIAASLGRENIRANAISAGPIRTLAASGIKDFRSMLGYNEKTTLLKRNITTREVGNTAAFLCSDLASGITGQVVYVDAGFHVAGMPDAL